jgi:hypothetical protein
MMFSSNAFRFVIVLAAACNAVTSATPVTPAVDIGNAENYVMLTKSGISTIASVITGDIAVSPIAATAMTGFGLALDWEGEYSKSSQITGEGKAYAANYGGSTPVDLTTAVSNMETAYTNAAGLPIPIAERINLNGGVIGVVGVLNGGDQLNPLTPGVYTFGSDVTIAETTYFDGNSDVNSVFVMQIAGNLVQAAGVRVELTNGALAKNIFWQVSGAVEVGEGAHMQGIILAFTDVLFETGSSLSGRVLAQTACVLQAGTTITQPPVF